MALRQNAYRTITSIEKMLKDAHIKQKTKSQPEKQEVQSELLHIDINLDGHKEFVYWGASFSAAVESEHGSLCMLQRRSRSKKSWNYCAGIFAVQNGLYAPWSFRETIVLPSKDIAQLHVDMLQNKYEHNPLAFSQASFNKELASLIFSQHEHVPNAKRDVPSRAASQAVPHEAAGLRHDPPAKEFLLLEKQYSFRANAVQVFYRIRNNSAANQDALLAVEINLDVYRRAF